MPPRPIVRFLPFAVCALALAACDRSPTQASSSACDGRQMSVAVGEVVSLQPAQGVCNLGTHAGAEYAVVYLDTRITSVAHEISEPYRAIPGSYAVHIIDATAGASAALRTILAESAAPDFVVDAGEPDALTSITYHPEPWVVGDTVTTPGCTSGECVAGPPVAARVERVYGNWLVVAVDPADPARAEILGQLDEAFPHFEREALPLLADVFGPARPSTSPGANQVFVLARSSSGTFASYALTFANGDDAYGWLLLTVAPANVASTVSLLAHEVAHLYQRRYMHATRSAGVAQSNLGPTAWGVEGSANLISYEVIRRLAGTPLAGNYDWLQPSADPFVELYARRAQSTQGAFSSGYDGTMPFLRDLVIRRMRAGDAQGTALREVTLGALEGWSGIDFYSSTRPGMITRMRARLGSGWTPTEALLTWVLSHVGDDRNPSTTYQDHASLRAWDIRDFGWRADGVLTGGWGGRVSVARPYSSPGYSYLRDSGAGVQVRLSADIPEVEWRLMRIR